MMDHKDFLRKYQKVPLKHYPTRVPENPLVSVCVQTYRHKNFIRECLDGILMQETDFDYEILLGEDASTDGTREICIEYAEKYPDKIRLFLHSRENNIAIGGHPTGRFNFLYNLYEARGKYIALCEGDDYWADNRKLQQQIDWLEENPSYGMCFHNATVINGKGDSVEMGYSDFHWNGISREKNDYSLYDLLKTPLCPTASVVVRKPDNWNLPKWFVEVPSGDMALWALLNRGGHLIRYFDQNWSAYRKHAEGVSIQHSGTWIHVGRIKMYLRLKQEIPVKYRAVLLEMITVHGTQCRSLHGLSLADGAKLFWIAPSLTVMVLIKYFRDRIQLRTRIARVIMNFKGLFNWSKTRRG